MKSVISYWSVVATTLLFARPLVAQDDLSTMMPLKRAVSPVSASAELKLKPETAAKLQGLRAEIAKNKYSFQVAHTEVADRPVSELCGTKAPKPINAASIEQQEKLNAQTRLKIQAEFKANKVSASAQGPGAVSGYPSCWWGSGWFSPIKNQGNCGSCWAFAATAAFEHAHKKFYGTVPDVSEQHIVDCGVTGGGVDAGSCNGGWSDRALDYMRCYGAPNESAKPYRGYDQNCTYAPKKHYAYYWGQLYNGHWPTRDEIKAYVSYYGSVVTYMRAGVGGFGWYNGGVFNGYPNTNPYDIDHAVTIVGWCDQYNAWIIKNSWGTNWGYSGYAYVDYNNCNIGKFVYYVMPYQSSGRISAPGSEPAPKQSGSTTDKEVVINTEKSPIIESTKD
jgi:C1A family cysteine protease